MVFLRFLNHIPKRFILIAGGIFGLLLLSAIAIAMKAQWTIHKMSVFAIKENEYQLFEAFADSKERFEHLTLPKKESDRENFLVVGMRGFGKEYGELLTDTIMLASIQKQTNRVALISIPRDLLVTIPYNGRVKINELYSMGYAGGGEKLAFNLVKTVVSQISGVYIDGMVRIDFDGFEKLVDELGGIDIYLDKPFQEIQQWEGIGGFLLPQGWNHLDGKKALFFVRSRFSTSDFDRSRRQQEVLLAFKEKLSSLGAVSNPIKIYRILDIVGNHVKMDVSIGVQEAVALLRTIQESDITHLILSTQNYLIQGEGPNGSYILLPKGDNFDIIRSTIQTIFNTSLPT